MISEIEQIGPEGARDVRAAIVAAAEQLFADKGYNATSVREVVEQAGCRKPALYYYFANKEDLYVRVLQRACDALEGVLLDALSGPGSVRERLLRTLKSHLEFVRSNETCLRLCMTAERHPEQGQPFFDFDALRQRHIDTVRAVLVEGVECGELRGDLDLEEVVLCMFGMVDHRLVLLLHGRPIPDDYPERLLDLIFNGVGACRHTR